jgi:hypothetical protein
MNDHVFVDASVLNSVNLHAAAPYKCVLPQMPSTLDGHNKGDSAMAHVILFEKRYFHGNHKHVFRSEANLNAEDDDWMNDQTRSIVVVEGQWQFFKDWNFEQPSYLGTLGPGVYETLEPYLGSNAVGSISSLRPTDSVDIKSKGKASTVSSGPIASRI